MVPRTSILIGPAGSREALVWFSSLVSAWFFSPAHNQELPGDTGWYHGPIIQYFFFFLFKYGHQIIIAICGLFLPVLLMSEPLSIYQEQ